MILHFIHVFIITNILVFELKLYFSLVIFNKYLYNDNASNFESEISPSDGRLPYRRI